MAWQDRNPWEMTPEELTQAAGGQQTAPAAQAPPSVIYGPPKVEEAPKPPSGYVPVPGGLRPVTGGPADPYRPGGELDPNKPKNDPKLREGQEKASTFLTRALGANRSYEAQDIGPRSSVGQVLQDNVPTFLNSLPSNIGNSPERQVADSAQDEFISATLRYDSGAAIPPEELERQRRIYFPMPGDGEEAIRQKRTARLRALAGLVQSAGPAVAPNILGVLKEMQGEIDSAARGESTPGRPKAAADEIVIFSGESAPATGFRFPEGAQEAIFAEARRLGATVDSVQAVAQRFGGSVDPATVADAIKRFRENPNAPVGGLNYAPADKAAQIQEEKERFGDYLPQAIEERKSLIVDPVVRGLADVVPFSDELVAGGNTILQGGTYTDNLRRERAVDEADRRENFGARLTGQLAGAALPIGRLAGFGRVAAGTRSALSYGAEGAALGGLYAAGNADPNPDAPVLDQWGERLSAAPIGAALGAGLGAGLGALGNRFRRPPTTPPAPPGGGSAADIARAAQAEGVPISRPIVDPSRRDAMAVLETSLAGGPVVQKSLRATEEGIERRVGELGQGGTVQDEHTMGSIVQDAARRYKKNSRTRVDRLYDRAAQMAGNARVEARTAVAKLDQEIAALSGNRNLNEGEIAFLNKVRADLVDANGNVVPKTVAELRDIRTNLRGRIAENGQSFGQAEARVIGALDAAKDDIARDLAAANPAAVKAYARADKAYRERQGELKAVVQRVLGTSRDPNLEISPERAWANLRTMAAKRGASSNLDRLWGKLEPSEQRDAAATLAETFGSTPGQLLAGTKNLSGRALETVFGPQGRQSIENLRVLSRAYLDTSRRLNNSRSGMVINWGNELKALATRGGVGAAIGGAIGGVPGAAVGAAAGSGAGQLAKYLTARALMSPDMTRWLAAAPRQSTPAAIRQHITDGLSAVARRDPAIAQDALGLQRYLQQAFAESPSRAAASGEDEKQ